MEFFKKNKKKEKYFFFLAKGLISSSFWTTTSSLIKACQLIALENRFVLIGPTVFSLHHITKGMAGQQQQQGERVIFKRRKK